MYQVIADHVFGECHGGVHLELGLDEQLQGGAVYRLMSLDGVPKRACRGRDDVLFIAVLSGAHANVGTNIRAFYQERDCIVPFLVVAGKKAVDAVGDALVEGTDRRCNCRDTMRTGFKIFQLALARGEDAVQFERRDIYVESGVE